MNSVEKLNETFKGNRRQYIVEVKAAVMLFIGECFFEEKILNP